MICFLFCFVLLACVGVWLLFNGLLAHLFSLFYVISEFDRVFIEDEPIIWSRSSILAASSV